MSFLPARTINNQPRNFIIGLDLAKRDTQMAVLDQAGQLLGERKFASTRQNFQALGSELLPDDVVALEASISAFTITSILAASNSKARLIVSNPVKTRAIADSRVKTDRIDARVLAELARVAYLPEIWVPDADTASLRLLVKDRRRLVRRRSELKNNLQSVLERNLLFFEKSRLFDPVGYRWLASLLLPDEVSEISDLMSEKTRTSRHDKRTSNSSCGVAGDYAVGRPAGGDNSGESVTSASDEAATVAPAAVPTDLMEQVSEIEQTVLPQSDRARIISLISEIESLNDKILTAEIAIARFIDGVPQWRTYLDHLLSIPGVSFVIAAGLISVIGDISRFPTPKRLAAYFGLVPKTKQSGEAAPRHGHITRMGSSEARWLSVEATHQLAATPGPLHAFFNRVSKRRGRAMAYVALARKLAELVWHLLSRDEDYLYTNPVRTRRKRKEVMWMIEGLTQTSERRRDRLTKSSSGLSRNESALYGTGLVSETLIKRIARQAAAQAEEKYRVKVENPNRVCDTAAAAAATTVKISTSGFEEERHPTHTKISSTSETAVAHQTGMCDKSQASPVKNNFDPTKPRFTDWQSLVEETARDILREELLPRIRAEKWNKKAAAKKVRGQRTSVSKGT